MTPEENQEYARLVGKLKVYGDRVALIEVTEENDTGFFFPEERKRAWILERVIAVGDGVVRSEDKPRTMWLRVGDIVLLQFNEMMVAQCGCKIDDSKILVVPQGDVIGTLDEKRVNADTFHVTGSWVICRVEIPQKVGEIYLPSGQQVPSSVGRPRYYVIESGPGVDLDLAKDDEVKLNPGRANLIKLKDTLAVYIDQDFVLAKVTPGKQEAAAGDAAAS